MENLGYLAVLLAFLLSAYAAAAALGGKLRRNPFLELSAQRAVLGAWLMTTAASAILLHAILTDNFSFNYVASRSNADLDLLYKIAAWWGGQEGSLLFWSWIAATYTFVAVYTGRGRHRNMISYVVATMGATQAFFLGLVAFNANPFQVIMSGPQITAVPDGQGLNPLLQHPMMAIHPPMLYLGYVGFTVPFAFALASLITRQPGERWIHTTRVWTMVTWLFQSIGILLGARWAYVVLGWGGYWGWDPVENASLLPWLTGTAFLHSVMMQEKKGMMKVWNIVLISSTFFLCIFGTMMTRGGLVSSVHAFAESDIGIYFVWFLAIAIAITAYLIVTRLDYLRSEAELDSVVSRESSFLFNNVVLLASCFAVLWGTLFPVISEYVTGDKITVGAPFFNKVNVPIGLFLLFLTGVGPLFAWRRTSTESLRRNFLWPAVAAALCAAALVAAGMRHYYATVCFALCAFVTATVLTEFYRGGRVIQRKTGSGLLPAMVELTRRNTRRYGGYIVHMAIVLMFVGFAGAAFNRVHQQEMAVGDSVEVGSYAFKLQNVSEMDTPNYFRAVASIDVSKGGDFLETLLPERRFYHASSQPTSRVDVRNRLREDVYVVYAGQSSDGENPVIQVYINPLVNWIWIGSLLLVLGTLVALVPSKTGRRPKRAPALKEHPVAVPGD